MIRLSSNEVPSLPVVERGRAVTIREGALDGIPVRVVFPAKPRPGVVLIVHQIMEEIQGEPLALFISAESTEHDTPYLVCAAFHGEKLPEYLNRENPPTADRLRLLLPIVDCVARIHAFRYRNPADPDSGLETVRPVHGMLRESIGIADGRAVLLDMGAVMLSGVEKSQADDVADLRRLLAEHCGFRAEGESAAEIASEIRERLGISIQSSKIVPALQVAAVCAVLVVACLLAFKSSSEAARRQLARDEVERTLSAAVRELDELGKDGDLVKREAALRRAFESIESLDGARTRSARYADLLVKLGDYEGLPHAAGMGRPTEAATLYRRAADMLASDRTPDALSVRVTALQRLGSALLRQGRATEAETVLEEADREGTTMPAEFRALTLCKLGDCRLDPETFDQAEPRYVRARRLVKSRKAGRSPAVRQMLAVVLTRFVELRSRQPKPDFDEAFTLALQVRTIMDALRREFPQNVRYRRDADNAVEQVALVLERKAVVTGRVNLYLEAVAFRLEALTDYEQVEREGFPEASRDVARQHLRLGADFEAADDPVSARRHLLDAWKFYRVPVDVADALVRAERDETLDRLARLLPTDQYRRIVADIPRR